MKTKMDEKLDDEKPDVIIIVEDKKITLMYEEDFSHDIREICLEIFDRFYGERCRILISSFIPHYILEVLKMLHIDAKLNEDTNDIEFWTNKNNALLFLDEAITLDEYEIPVINRIMRWCSMNVAKIFKDNYPDEYVFIDGTKTGLWMGFLDHMVCDITISNEKGDVKFERYMAESLREGARIHTYFIKSNEKQKEFLKFLNNILKQKNIKTKIKNEQYST